VSYVVINAINVPQAQHDAMAERFAKRAGMVEQAEGFESFRLLRPADGKDVWLVVTQWRDEEAFKAWMGSAAFGQQHGQQQTQGSPATGNEVWAFEVAQQVG
jgi:heme-degrading monooxygenase HmoA